MGHGDTRQPPRQRGARLVPLMRARLTPPHGRHHKAPPPPCALTTTRTELENAFVCYMYRPIQEIQNCDVREFCRNGWRRVLHFGAIFWEAHLEEDRTIRVHMRFDKCLASGSGLADARIVMPSYHRRSSGFSPRSRRKT